MCIHYRVMHDINGGYNVVKSNFYIIHFPYPKLLCSHHLSRYNVPYLRKHTRRIEEAYGFAFQEKIFRV